MCLAPRWLCSLLVLISLVLKSETRVELTNIVCTSYDKKFSEFEYCYLKSINRSYKYVSGKLNVHQLPITKVKVNFALWKRFNGYKPFLYNFTLEACAFFRNPKSNPVANFVYGTLRDYSNVYYFKHGIIVDKLPIEFLNDRFTRILPFPSGDYLVKLHWLIGNFITASAEAYGTLS